MTQSGVTTGLQKVTWDQPISIWFAPWQVFTLHHGNGTIIFDYENMPTNGCGNINILLFTSTPVIGLIYYENVNCVDTPTTWAFQHKHISSHTY